MKPSTWAQQIKPSPTLAIKSVADRLREEGKRVYDFGIGEMNPEIPVPSILKQAIADAVMADCTHYSPAAGDAELLEAISGDLRLFGLGYTPEQIVICPGPKDAFFKACLTLLNLMTRRNRVVAFAPAYGSYGNIPLLLTGKPPIILQTDEHFLPNPTQLADLLSCDDTIALIILNSPNNPTGAVYPSALIEELAAIIGRYEEICVLSDEVYRTVIYDGMAHVSIASYLPNQTVVLGGVSKEVSGTGLRLGFIAAPNPLAQVVAIVEGNASSCVNLPTQKGYAHFLKHDTDLQQRYGIRDQLCERRNLLLERFAARVDRTIWEAPKGAFYFFPNMTHYLGTQTPDGQPIDTDEDLALYLLKGTRVVTLPGSKFQRPGHLRFAYAVSHETIDGGIQRLAEGLDRLL